MLRCVAQKHTGITGNEHLSPAKRYGEVRNKTQFAFSVAKSFCCRVISWFKITERGDPCHAGPGLLCSGSPTLYLAIVAVHPKYPKFSTMGENWVKHLETIDIYWYLLMSKYEGAPQLVVCSGSRLDHFASCYSDTSRKQDERLRFVQRLSSFSIWRVNYPKLWG